VIDGDDDTELVPEERYARMRNVWSIPSVPRLLGQLAGNGFTDARLVDLTPTDTREQRRTPWMTFDSLADCLDPLDQCQTVEGYPAPLRAGIIATCSP
jgi:tRNA (mo5U34)-methyltransferase